MSLFIVISPVHPDPMYKQITDQVRNAIAEGTIGSMYKLPSIREMAEELKISVITVKRAYQDLEKDGLIITRAGLGSFISELDGETLRREKMEEIREDIRRILAVGKKIHISPSDVIVMVHEEAEQEQAVDLDRAKDSRKEEG